MRQKRFKLAEPLIVAPMAGGPTTPELVAACCEAGAFGMLDGAYRTPARLGEAIAQVHTLTQHPFGVNLFVPTPMERLDQVQIAEARRGMFACCASLGVFDAPVNLPYIENFEQQFTVVLQHKPAALSFTFGTLTRAQVAACNAQDILTVGTATTLAEAMALQETGVDAIVAQGSEAGGHRGTFDATASEPGLGTAALCAALAGQLRIPFFASGGIMEGAGIAAALEAGAAGAQLGTAFLLCPEAGTSPPYRQALQQRPHCSTALTRAFSGRLARGLENAFMRQMRDQATALLPFPAQNILTRAMRARSVALGNSDYLSLWAGTGHGAVRTVGAGELVKALLAQMRAHA